MQGHLSMMTSLIGLSKLKMDHDLHTGSLNRWRNLTVPSYWTCKLRSYNLSYKLFYTAVNIYLGQGLQKGKFISAGIKRLCPLGVGCCCKLIMYESSSLVVEFITFEFMCCWKVQQWRCNNGIVKMEKELGSSWKCIQMWEFFTSLQI